MLGPVAGRTRALTRNGNLTNTRKLMEVVRRTSGEDLTGEPGRGSFTDTAVVAALLGLVCERGALEGTQAGADDGAAARLTVSQGTHRVLLLLRGACSLVFKGERTLYAARDRHGVRPLVLGRLEHGWAVASEPAALDIVGATFVREETVLRVAQAAGWTAWLLGDVREAARHTA